MFYESKDRAVLQLPLPPSAFPSPVSGLVLHLPAAAPLSARTGEIGVRAQGGGTPWPRSGPSAATGTRAPPSARQTETCTIESIHTHTYLYMDIHIPCT